MNQERQCEKCKKWFSSTLRYCPKCGTYWKQGKQQHSWVGGILKTEKTGEKSVLPEPAKDGMVKAINPLPDRYIVCERCKREIPVIDDMLPDFCCFCNEMVDGLAEVKTRGSSTTDKLKSQSETERQAEDNTGGTRKKKRGPLDRNVKADRSTISFIWIGPNGNVRLSEPRVDGDIYLGTKGNYERGFFSNASFKGVEEQQAQVFHKPDGWHIIALGPNVRHDNMEISKELERKLKDGSRIHLGDCALIVEIKQRT